MFQLRIVRLCAATAALLFAGPGLASPGHSGHDHGAHAKALQTLTGEVMDLACFMQHPKTGQGPEHAKCAAQCINKGLPAGLKVGDKLYLLMGKGHDSITDKLAALAGQQATFKGMVIERGGMTTLVVHEMPTAPNGK